MSSPIKNYLKQLIAFQSVSSDPEKGNISRKTAEFIIKQFKNLGAETKLVENELTGKNPLLFAKFITDENMPTILCYSHYDVQPASIDDGWDTDPYNMIEKEDEGYLYGRGVNDDKGPIASAYFAVKELIEEGTNCNVAFLYEGEEESGSDGFEDTVKKNKDFFGKIDGILILDTSWFGDNRPSMDYGFRGIAYLGIEISGPNKDQHSGFVGGSIREPMADLIFVMSKLITPDGKILIDGFFDDVKEVTDEEEKLYENVEFDLDDFVDYLGKRILLVEDAKTTLMNMWRNPSLSFHGIQGAFSGIGSKTVVPAKVMGKVSMRLVPDQNSKEIAELTKKYIKKAFKDLNSPNSLKVKTLGIGDWWYGDVENFLFKAGQKAIKEYWNIDPSFTRSGGSIPIIPFLEKLFSAPAMGLGIGQSTDGAHSQNERIRIKNLIGGKEVIKRIFKEISNQ